MSHYLKKKKLFMSELKRIKIISADEGDWYANRIGVDFNVIAKPKDGMYQVDQQHVHPADLGRYFISVDHCVEAVNREQEFIQYYSLSMILMRLSKYNLEMAMEYSTSRRLKRTLSICASAQEARIAEATAMLRTESRHDMAADLSSDEIKAIGCILHEMLFAENILEIEAEVIDFIRGIKKESSESFDSNG
jgi:hypothetical protein